MTKRKNTSGFLAVSFSHRGQTSVRDKGWTVVSFQRSKARTDTNHVSTCVTQIGPVHIAILKHEGRATSIDRENKAVVYSKVSHGGSCSDPEVKPLAYDVLVLCTGSFCFVPPTPGFILPEKKNPQWPDDPASRPEGVFVYRTIEDLEALIAAAKNGSKRAAVIGGGLFAPREDTLMFNGYEEEVASLYEGMDLAEFY